ncbi:MAG: NAD(P)H-dependent oxidoreductase, partial [Parachlamydiaceae bacterium]|nr:NAD(P)H-dependent oxidoreductase [Parachlamydiaceae bacterium]
EGSLNKKLALNAAEMARQMRASVTFIDLRDYPMPFYDGDLEATMGMPSNVKQLRKHFVESQVILIASPEYNASVSAVLKNAIDWVSRNPNGGGSREAFKDKKVVIMSISPGKNGGARGLSHLRTILEDVSAIVLPQQVSVPNGNSAFDGNGILINLQAKNELQQLLKKAIN